MSEYETRQFWEQPFDKGVIEDIIREEQLKRETLFWQNSPLNYRPQFNLTDRMMPVDKVKTTEVKL